MKTTRKMARFCALLGALCLVPAYASVPDASGLPLRLEEEPSPDAKIVYLGHMPKIQVHGQLLTPNWMIPNGNLSKDGALEYEDDAVKKLYDVGFRVFEVESSPSYFWKGEGRYDFSRIGARVTRILTLCPDAYITVLLRVSLPDWAKAHPDETVVYGRPSEKPGDKDEHMGCPIRPSAASIPFRAELKRIFEAFAAYAKSQPWKSRLIGMRPGYGIYTEWHTYGMWNAPDCGKAMTRRFREWLAEHGRPDPDAEVPHESIRYVDGRLLLDPVKDRRLLDYYQCNAETMADLALYIGDVWKKAMPGALYGTYYGYVMATQAPEGSNVLMDKMLSSPLIDFMADPSEYLTVNRRAGGGYLHRTLLSPFHRYGKLSVLEDDSRFYNIAEWANPGYLVPGKDESVAVAKRNYLNTVFDGCGYQTNDPEKKAGKRPYSFDDPAVLASLKAAMGVARAIEPVSKDSGNDTVVVASPRERLCAGTKVRGNEFFETLYWSPHKLHATGAAFDTMAFEDFLASGKTYKRILFLNVFSATDEERKALKGKIAKNTKAAYITCPGATLGAEFWKSLGVTNCVKPPKTAKDAKKILASLGTEFLAQGDGKFYFRRHANYAMLHVAEKGAYKLKLGKSGKIAKELFSGREFPADGFEILSEGPETWFFQVSKPVAKRAKKTPLPPLEDGAFTYAVIPDTQRYLGEGCGWEGLGAEGRTRNPAFESRVQWLVDHIKDQRIAFVSHVGDITDKNNDSQWKYVSDLMGRFEGKVPFGITAGNHDMTDTGDTSLFRKYYPVERFSKYPWYAGNFEGYTTARGLFKCGGVADTCQLFEAGGERFVVLHLECNAPDKVLAWVDSMLDKHADRHAIVCTHAYLGPLEAGYRNYARDVMHGPYVKRIPDALLGRMRWITANVPDGNTGEDMWRKCFSKHKNLFLVVCGDQSAVMTFRQTSVGEGGNVVSECIQDYPRTSDDSDWLRLYRINPKAGRIDVITYSPRQDTICQECTFFDKPVYHQFTLPFPSREGAKTNMTPLPKDLTVARTPAPNPAAVKKGRLAAEKPKAGATVRLMNAFQSSYAKMPRKERIDAFANADFRAKMYAFGDRPEPTYFRWADNGAGSYEFEIRRKSDGKVFYRVQTNVCTLAVSGFEIGTGYEWTVKGGGEEASSSFVTEGVAPRMLVVEGVPNVRDLGGRKGLDGCRVRQGLLFRSAGLNDGSRGRYRKPKFVRPGAPRLTDATRRYLKESLGIKTDIDLRTDEECFGMTESPLGPDVKWVRVPFPTYGDMFEPWGMAAFRKVFTEMLDDKNYPLDFHCVFGADRTGSLGFVIEALLGVSEEEMYRDWEWTGFCEESLGFCHTNRLVALAKPFAKLPGTTPAEKAVSYVRECGFSSADIERFRAIMLEGYKPKVVDERTISLLAPREGETVKMLRHRQREFLRKSDADRRALFKDTGFRKEISRTAGTPPEVVLKWSGTDGEKAVVDVRRMPDGQAFCSVTTKVCEVRIDNLEIARTYEWTVQCGESKATGHFKTEDVVPRLIRVPGVLNMRDLGGRRGLDGRRVRQGRVYRSAGLNGNAKTNPVTNELGEVKHVPYAPGKVRLNQAAIHYMTNTLGIKSDIDLRGEWECFGMDGSPLGGNVTWFHIDSSRYAGIFTDWGRTEFAKAFKVFLDEKNYPIDFHCIHGKNRTGTLAFVLNALLGVVEDDLVRDWEVTTFCDTAKDFLHEGKYDELVAAFSSLPGKDLREKAEAYVKSCGFTDADIARFRSLMLE